MSFTPNAQIRKRIQEYCRQAKVATINSTAEAVVCNRITARRHLRRMAQDGVLEELARGRLSFFLFTEVEK